MFKASVVALFVGLVIHVTGLDWSQVPPVEEWSTPWAVDPDVAAAVQVRCADGDPVLHAECAEELSQHFASGELEPLAVLRTHCTRWEGPWTSPQPAPRQCVEHFGGWIRG